MAQSGRPSLAVQRDITNVSAGGYDGGPMDELAPPVPRYSQIAQRLREAIVAGEHRPGTAIPSESQLADRYGVSRAVVRQAIALLTTEGLLTVVGRARVASAG